MRRRKRDRLTIDLTRMTTIRLTISKYVHETNSCVYKPFKFRIKISFNSKFDDNRFPNQDRYCGVSLVAFVRFRRPPVDRRPGHLTFFTLATAMVE